MPTPPRNRWAGRNHGLFGGEVWRFPTGFGQGPTPPCRLWSAPGLSRTLVITPTYDERDNLPVLVERLQAVDARLDLLVVDDASPDGTGALADELHAHHGERVRVLHRPGKQGLGSAYVAGFRRALAEGYDVVVQMDADLSHDPRAVPLLLGALDRGADLAIGSRWVPGGGIEGWGLGRLALSRGGSLYSRWILGTGVRDMTSGFKAIRRRVLEALDPDSIRAEGYSFQIEVTYRALAAGFRVEEVPILFVDRRAGHSKLSRSIFVEAIGMPWRLRLGGRR